MYGIYANIWGILMVNVTIYSSTMDPMGVITLDHHHPLDLVATQRPTIGDLLEERQRCLHRRPTAGAGSLSHQQSPGAESRLKGRWVGMNMMKSPWISMTSSEILPNFSWLMVFHGLFHAEKPAQNTIMSPSFSQKIAFVFSRSFQVFRSTTAPTAIPVVGNPLWFPLIPGVPRGMTFDEAMELAYFGGQVLHPSAMVPCIEERIPVLVKTPDIDDGGCFGGKLWRMNEVCVIYEYIYILYII